MKDLNKLALELTKENLVKSRTSKKSINSFLVDILGSNPKLKRTRIELTNEITMLRLQENEEINEKSFEDKEFIERFKKMNKTVKNGLDTSIAQGKSVSCFVSSTYGQEWTLIHNDDKTYSMTKIEVKK